MTVFEKLYFKQYFVFVVPISSKNVKSGVLAAESPKELQMDVSKEP